MQFALKEGLEVAIDRSIYDHTPFSSRTELHDECVDIKGSPNPILVFTLSQNNVSVASKTGGLEKKANKGG